MMTFITRRLRTGCHLVTSPAVTARQFQLIFVVEVNADAVQVRRTRQRERRKERAPRVLVFSHRKDDIVSQEIILQQFRLIRAC